MNDELRQQVEEAKATSLREASREIEEICERRNVSLTTMTLITPDGRIVSEVQLVSNG